MSQAITPKGAVVTGDGVIIWVWVITSGVGGIPLDGGIIGAGHTWHWHSIAIALIIGGVHHCFQFWFWMALPLVGRWKLHRCWLCGWGYTYLGVASIGVKWGVDDCSLGDFPSVLCSHHWGGLGGQA